MIRERFDKVLKAAGVANAAARDALWRTRPSDDLNEAALTYAATEALKEFPEAGIE